MGRRSILTLMEKDYQVIKPLSRKHLPFPLAQAGGSRGSSLAAGLVHRPPAQTMK